MALCDRVEEFALSLPEAWTDTPWHDSHVTKVRKKVFAFHGTPDDPGLSVKMTDSLGHALAMQGARPMGYGLGRHGWTYIPFADLTDEDAEVLLDFVEESYRVVAPKTLVKQLDADRHPPDHRPNG
jgi:predicted DNA-binding protein (MmcQ/YjbR family)